MLTIALLYAVIFVSCICAGFLFYRLPVPGITPAVRSIAIQFFTGLIMITGAVQVLCLFMPVNALMQGGILVALLVGCAMQRTAFVTWIRSTAASIRSLTFMQWMATAVLLLMILAINAGPTLMDDTDSYHIQMIKWLKEYGTVPGLVHIHSRFGFNSSWFSAVAFFDLQHDHFNYFTTLNGLTGLVLMTRLTALLFNTAPVTRGLRLAAAAVLALCLFSWPLFRGNAATANYDFISVAMVVVLGFELMAGSARARDGVGQPPTPVAELMLWPLFLFTVRIMNFPLLLITLWVMLVSMSKDRRFLVTSLTCGSLLIVPFLIRNVLLSGYLFYPSLSFDVFPVDWKADTAATNALLDYIFQYNKISTQYQPISVTRTMNFGQWFPLWLEYLFPYDRVLLMASVAGLMTTTLMLLKRSVRAAFSGHSLLLQFVLVLIIQGFAWFLVAPDPRFYYGPLLCWVAIPLWLLTRLPAWPVMRGNWIPGCTLLLVLGYGVHTFTRADSAYLGNALVLPSRLPEPELGAVMIGGIRANKPEIVLKQWNPRCYDTELPCLYEIDERVVPRGASISDGFRLSPAAN